MAPDLIGGAIFVDVVLFAMLENTSPRAFGQEVAAASCLN